MCSHKTRTLSKEPPGSLGLMTSQFPFQFRHVILVRNETETEVKLWPPISSLVPKYLQFSRVMSRAELSESSRKFLPGCDTKLTSCMVELDKKRS